MPIRVTDSLILPLHKFSSKAEILFVLNELKYNEKFVELEKIISFEHPDAPSVLSSLADQTLEAGITILLTKQNNEELTYLSQSAYHLSNWIKNKTGITRDLSSKIGKKIFGMAKIQNSLRVNPVTLPIITEGPLERNAATKLIIHIYQEALKNNVNFNINGRHEILVMTNGQLFNLTYLLGEADFTQFQIDNDNSDKSVDQFTWVITDAERDALSDYSIGGYECINALLRTGKLINFPDADIKDIFLKSCNIAHALNKFLRNKHLRKSEVNLMNRYFHLARMPYLKANSMESCHDREHLFAILDYAQLRGIFSLAECNEIVEFHFVGDIRKSDYVPKQLAYNEGMMSSARGKIAPLFIKNHTVWSNHGIAIFDVVKNDTEAEVLILSGQQHFFANMDGLTYAIPINTPSLQKRKDYPWLLALAYSYDNHLSKPYKESIYDAYANIPRHNHGLSHTTRSIHYLDAVVEFYAKHEGNEEHRTFYETLSRNTLDKLKIALAFYVTGRESEVSWRVDLARVIHYAKVSVENFKKYAMSQQWPVEEIDKYAKFLGPQSERVLCGVEEICLNQMIDVAHRLDLPRCYNAEEMRESVDVKGFPKLTRDLAAAKKDWAELKKWTIECIKATGDCLFSAVNSSGDYVDYDACYDDNKFVPASQDPLACLQLLRKVPDFKLLATEPNLTQTRQVGHFEFQEEKSVEATCDLLSYDSLVEAQKKAMLSVENNIVEYCYKEHLTFFKMNQPAQKLKDKDEKEILSLDAKLSF